MKKMILALFAMLTMTVGANAMSYEQARREALFLTDKMAYELNLTDEQYEAAYEINLDYLMSVTGRANVFGTYWERRNLDLSYILYSWQWEAFCAATYFYRPLYWDAGYWHFGIYARYPRRDYFYFGRPHFYVSYRGGHSWRSNGGRSFYEGRHTHYRPHNDAHHLHSGMRDGWDRGDYRGHGGSSTRVTGGGHHQLPDRHSGHVDRPAGGSRSNPNGSLHGNSNRWDNSRSNPSGTRSTRPDAMRETPRSSVGSTPRSSSAGASRSSSVEGSRSAGSVGAMSGSRSGSGSYSGGSSRSHGGSAGSMSGSRSSGGSHSGGGSRGGSGSFGGNRSQH